MQAQADKSSLVAFLKRRLEPSAPKMAQIADFAQGQVRERFQTGGVSGGRAWPPGVMPTGKRPPLAGLETSYHRRAEYGVAVVASSDFRAYVNDVGTIGKGGLLPDLVPRKARAMYIPLTQVGLQAYWERNSAAPTIDTGYGTYYIERPTRMFFEPVQEAEKGVDFIFLAKAAIPPRPQLPTSDREIEALGDFVHRTLLQ